MTRPLRATDLLSRLVADDPGRPRITSYDDTDSLTRGERIELSAAVLQRWVAKAANLLQDECDAGPGTTVRLDLPAHWRTLYWALATWTVGATLDLTHSDGRADVLVTLDPEADGADQVIVVTLPALARRASVALPPGVIDEAADLASFPDDVDPWQTPQMDDVALRTEGGEITYADLVRPFDEAARRHTGTDDVATLLSLAVSTWAAGGSLVHSRGTADDDVLAARLTAEGVTHPA